MIISHHSLNHWYANRCRIAWVINITIFVHEQNDDQYVSSIISIWSSSSDLHSIISIIRVVRPCSKTNASFDFHSKTNSNQKSVKACCQYISIRWYVSWWMLHWFCRSFVWSLKFHSPHNFQFTNSQWHSFGWMRFLEQVFLDKSSTRKIK